MSPSLGPLADHLPLELCQSAEDVEDQFSTAGRGVDLLGQALETDAPLLQRVIASIRCGSDRPRRSSFHTTRCPRADVAERLLEDLADRPWHRWRCR